MKLLLTANQACRKQTVVCMQGWLGWTCGLNFGWPQIVDCSFFGESKYGYTDQAL